MDTSSPSSLQSPRLVERLVRGQLTQDGAGVKLTRVLTHDLQHRLDPFLMLDHFGSDDPKDYIAGFPNHPHRGFETVTYMIQGRMRHNDSAGNEGLLQNGGMQWMTAGRGVIHSELPEQEEGVMEGFQLWLNLAARDKMQTPWYKDFQAADIPELTTAQGARVKIVAGQCQNMAGAMQREVTHPLYLAITLAPGAIFEQPLDADFNAFVFCFRGQVQIRDQTVPLNHMGLLANTAGSDGVRLCNPGQVESQCLLIAGRPLNEPIAQYGPFVMNKQSELIQAVRDYQSGTLA